MLKQQDNPHYFTLAVLNCSLPVQIEEYDALVSYEQDKLFIHYPTCDTCKATGLSLYEFCLKIPEDILEPILLQRKLTSTCSVEEIRAYPNWDKMTKQEIIDTLH